MPLFFILLFLALAAYGQQLQQRVAVINTVDDGEPPIKNLESSYLTDKLRETASNVLPKSQYGVMTTESIVAFFGSHERLVKVCNESSCLVELGRKVSADFVAQARIGRFGKDLTLKTELYDTKNGTLVGSFTGYSKDIYGLLTLIDEKAPDLFKKLPNALGGSSTPPPVAVFAAPQEETEPEVAKKTEDEPYEPPEEMLLDRMAAANRKQVETQPSLLSLDLPNRLQLGFRSGISFSQICDVHENVCSDNISGMQLGFVLDIAVNEWLYIQPGIMYIQKGKADDHYEVMTQKTFHYFELPLLISFKLFALRLNAGPYIDIPNAGDDVDWSLDPEIGLSVGIGFNIWMFYIGMFHDTGFLNGIGNDRTLCLNVGVNL